MSGIRHFPIAPPIFFGNRPSRTPRKFPLNAKLFADPIEFRRDAEFEAMPAKHCFEPGTFFCLEC